MKNIITQSYKALIILICTLNVSYSQVETESYPYGYDTELGIDTTGMNSVKSGKSTKAVIYTLKINEFLAVNGTINQDSAGEYDDWIELYNYGTLPIDLQGVFFTDDLSDSTEWEIPSSLIIPAGGYLILWADDDTGQGVDHLGFKLEDTGEEIGIFTPDSIVLIDQEIFGTQVYNISKGRQPDGGVNWNFFDTPTPGASNITTGMLNIVPNPNFSLSGGFYNDTFSITLDVDTLGATIYYTTDGSTPNQTSAVYIIPIFIDNTKIIRAIAYKSSCVPSRVVTHTYFMNVSSTIPVLSVSSSTSDIWGFNVDVSVHVEYFEEDGSLGFSIDGGTQSHGKISQAQESFRLHARTMYGDKEINYKIFDNKETDYFKRLVFRNAGNDGLFYGSRAHMRDGVINTAIIRSNSTTSTCGYQPVNVYINGNYHAIYNIRERIDRYYIEGTHGYDSDLPMDILERCFGVSNPTTNHDIIEGDWNDYNIVRTFADTADISIPANYNFLESRVHVKDFADYWITEVYFGNYDWLSNNIKLWKPDTLGAKFGWILWDVDHGLGMPFPTPTGNASDPNWNTLDWGTGTLPGDRPWGGLNTRLIRGLLEYPEFKEYFIVRFSDLLNSYFSPDSINTIIDSLENYLVPEIPQYVTKWGSSFSNWQTAVQALRTYNTARRGFVREHIKLQYSLNEMINLDLTCIPEDAGIINLNTITLSNFPWTGDYYSEMANTIEAIAKPGYEFIGWIGSLEDTSYITIYPDTNVSLTALFQPLTLPADTSIVINEINYNSSASFDTDDWVEFYNASLVDIYMGNWIFEDGGGNTFEFPLGFILQVDDYIVLCRDTSKFRLFYPNINNIIGNMDFGLSGAGELIKLYDFNGVLTDYVPYDDSFPWPTEPDGNGPTLVLKLPYLNNSIASSWEASELAHGSPGTADSLFLDLINNITEKPQIIVYPNPANCSVNFYMSLNKYQNIKISLFDIQGRKVADICDEKLIKGETIISYNIENKIMQGIYFYKLETDNFSQTKKLVITK